MLPDAIDPVGDMDLFFFQGSNGDTVAIQATRQSGGTPCVELFDPDGVQIDKVCTILSSARIDATLDQTGTHSILVTEYGNDATMDYALSYQCIGDCPHTPLFVDVPPGSFAEEEIYKIYNAGITTGCTKNPLKYCPSSPVTRAQMAIFLLRSKLGSSYTPPPAKGIFDDVPVGSFAADWIEDLFNRGITTGCQKNPLRYCPSSPVTRAQMAIFLLRSKLGSSYTPPAATGIFDDVPVGSFAADWIEDLFDRGITTGCQKNPLRYCPSSSITRAQMAIFLVRMFDL